jgi:hypothetical protein
MLTASTAVRAQHAHPLQAERHASEQGGDRFSPREASGTSWVPDESPMPGIVRTWREWELMLHGTAFAQFLYEPGDRHRTGGFSRRQVSSVNWGMAVARRPVGAGRAGLRAALSAEPWTVADCGFLNLLATGETCEGDTIHDRQHPHDLFMELAADYDRPLQGSLRWQIYAGLAGEPALGPAAFPHRLSAFANPVAPVSHHWLDSTHIAFGLVTTGLYQRRWKAEVSLFNGREPDQNRADLDLAALDSLSGRVSFMPTDRFALQVSAGRLREAEFEFPPQPRSDVNRTTTSATYHRPLRNDGIWATTIAYGVNSGREFVPGGSFEAVTHAALAETTLALGTGHTWFARAELVGKPAHDLHAHEYATRVFAVGKLQAGYVRYFAPWNGMAPGVGATAATSLLPSELAPRYFGRIAPGFGVFLTLRPRRHVM